VLERWTIDTLADEIERQLKAAEPQRKLLRRFFNEGKRNGRRSISIVPMKHFLADAVEIATSKISEAFLEEEHRREAQLAGLRARGSVLEAAMSDTGGDRDDDDPPSIDVSPDAGLAGPIGGPDLTDALGDLRLRRRARERDARAAQRRQQRAQVAKDLESVREQIAVVDQELEDLPESYRQMITSCHETGELLWWRYLQGTVVGAARRGVSGSGVEPFPEVEFDYPEVLRLDDGSGRVGRGHGSRQPMRSEA
jgi:hypothetical protein